MRTLTSLILLLIPTTLTADQIVLDSHGAKPGVVYLRVEVGQDGSLTAEHIPKVFTLDNKKQTVLQITHVDKVDEDPEPPKPPDPNNKPQPRMTELQQTVIDMASGIDDDNRRGTALVIAAVYDDIANLIESGVLGNMRDVWSATNTQYASTVRRYRKFDNWLEWKASTDDLLRPADLDEAMDLWREVAEALKDVQNKGG